MELPNILIKQQEGNEESIEVLINKLVKQEKSTAEKLSNLIKKENCFEEKLIKHKKVLKKNYEIYPISS